MMYIKKFNEELSSETYSSAADKLSRLSKKSGNKEFSKRADSLKHHGEIQGIKNNIREFSKYGKTTITSQYNEEGDTVSGDFYLNIFFEPLYFEETYQNYLNKDEISLNLSFGIIPVDMETREKFSILPDDDFSNGFFWGGWITLDLKDKGDGIEFSNIDVCSYDYNVTGRISFTRQLCLLIKKHLVACFDKNVDYNIDGYKMYDILEEEVLIKSGISSHFGIDMSNIKKIISDITPIEIMSSVLDRDDMW